MPGFSTRLFAALLVLPFAAGLIWADNWPTWRGPDYNGISHEKNFPVEWSESKNLVWKLPLPGMGGSTPVVWNDRIFLTSVRDKDLVLLCVSAEGKNLWERKLGVTTRGTVQREGVTQANEACASPSVDGTHVYALVGSGDLACFDYDGKEIWRCNIQQRYGKYNIYHGIHTSPLIHQDRLYLALLHSGGHWVVALDKKTGNEVWKIARATDAKSESREAYTSPILWDTGDAKQLIVHGADYTTAHRLEDGGEVWRLGLNNKKDYMTAFRMIGTPLATRDLLIITTTKNFSRATSPGPIIALKPGAKGDLTPGGPSELWRTTTGSPDIGSALLHDGLLYLCHENGFLMCVDAMNGKEVYRERRPAGRYSASPVLAEGKLYLTAYGGDTAVVQTGPKFKVLVRNELTDTFAASPALANGRIYLRGFKTLYAIQAGAK